MTRMRALISETTAAEAAARFRSCASSHREASQLAQRLRDASSEPIPAQEEPTDDSTTEAPRRRVSVG